MTAEQQEQYCREVLRFRKALNLTSISDPEAFTRRFIEPSLELANWLPTRGRLLDIGSGMGVPGIPLMIALPKIRGVLVERRKKRAEFLRHLIRHLGLNGEVYDSDINALAPLGIDACVARAVADQKQLLSMCGRHANANAIAVLPVPVESAPIKLKEWALEHEQRLRGFPDQLVRCYRFLAQNRGGGFT